MRLARVCTAAEGPATARELSDERMSGGYADRLKHYPNKGVCGLPENYDSERLLKANLRKKRRTSFLVSRIIILESF